MQDYMYRIQKVINNFLYDYFVFCCDCLLPIQNQNKLILKRHYPCSPSKESFLYQLLNNLQYPISSNRLHIFSSSFDTISHVYNKFMMVFSGFYYPVFTFRAQGTYRYHSFTISILLHQILEPLYLIVAQPIVQHIQIWRLGLPTFISQLACISLHALKLLPLHIS